jgi:hypothetical protein
MSLKELVVNLSVRRTRLTRRGQWLEQTVQSRPSQLVGLTEAWMQATSNHVFVDSISANLSQSAYITVVEDAGVQEVHPCAH